MSTKAKSRFEQSLAGQIALTMGEAWTVETVMSGSVLYATHTNGSRTRVFLSEFDKRRNASAEDAATCVERMRKFLAGEIPKYTEVWADKARAALANWPN